MLWYVPAGFPFAFRCHLTGGTTAGLNSPYLYKSADDGESWKFYFIEKLSDARVYDAIIHPTDPDLVLAGLGGYVNGVYKTSDGGEAWKQVYKGPFIQTLARSAKNPGTIYASGLSASASGILIFYMTKDFGKTWEAVEFTDGPTGVDVRDMISVMLNGQEVLYFGTRKGIYSYTFEERKQNRMSSNVVNLFHPPFLKYRISVYHF